MSAGSIQIGLHPGDLRKPAITGKLGLGHQSKPKTNENYSIMQIERSAGAVWKGDLKSGQGTTSTQSRVLQNTPYSFKTRFENDKQGTNPEELIAAAHASCFSMAFSKMLSDAGHAPKEIRTQARLTM